MNLNQLTTKQKRIGILVIVVLLLLLVHSCGNGHTSSSNNNNKQQAFSLETLIAASNKNASDDNKFYRRDYEYINKAGFSIKEFSGSRTNMPQGILYICNKDIDPAKMQDGFLQFAAILQNKKKLSDKDGEQLVQDLHLLAMDDATAYKATLGKYHFEKITCNSVNVGNIAGLQIPVTIIHFYPEGESEVIPDGSSNKKLSFEDYVKKTINNEVCKLDRQKYFYDRWDEKGSKLHEIK